MTHDSRASTRGEPAPTTGSDLLGVRSSDDVTLGVTSAASGSRVSRAGVTEKDREKERERERKEKEKADKEREKNEKKERERLEKEKKKDDKEREKLEKERALKEKLNASSKDPTPRTDDPKQMNCFWVDLVRDQIIYLLLLLFFLIN